MRLLFVPDVIILQSEGTYQGREREALDHERSQDHAERQEDYEVAVGKLCPRHRVKGQGEGRCERDHTPHPGPGYGRDVPPRRRRVALPDMAAEPARQVCRGENPQYAHQYDGQAHQDGVKD